MTRPVTRLLPVVALLALLPACGKLPMAPNALAAAPSTQLNARAVAGELIVRFKSTSRQSALQKLGLRTVKRINRLDAVVVKTTNPAEALKALKQDPEVLYAEPNFIAKAIPTVRVPKMTTPGFQIQSRGGDELLSQLWGMTRIEAPAAWAISAGSATVKVAVVDTGIDYTHPDLAGRVENGHDFINDDNDAMDDNEHGTHCSGTIAAGLDNGGVVGVAPKISLLAVKVLDAEGSGTYEAVANGIVFAADQGVAVISMSLGGPPGSQVIEDSVKYAIGKGTLVVAAMGNDNSENPSYPAAAPGVMAVGATTKQNKRSSFSNFGKHISVAAPGSEILSTVPGGKYDTFNGTSMATPHVAGLAALVKSKFPALDAAGIRGRIEKTADDHGDAGFDKFFGHGRINARRALAE